MEPLLDYSGDFARSLLSAAAATTNGTATIDSATSYLGSASDMRAAMGINWFAFSVCVLSLLYYAYHYSKQMTGWEEVYVCVIELAKVILELWWEPYAPATITTTDGKHVPWLRYAEWLLTCPVILIHMSNITGLNSEYNKRTMALLVSDIGTIVMGVAAAFGTGYVKVVFYLIGCAYAANQFINSFKVYSEAHSEVPDGRCKHMVKALGYLYFTSWMAFPLLFLLGPEGFHAINQWGSVMGHTISDLAAKNLWGLLAHQLRIMIAEEIVAGWDPEEHKIKKGIPVEETGHAAESNVVAVVRRLNSMSINKPGAEDSRRSNDKSGYATAAAGPVRVVLGVVATDMMEYFQSLVASVTVPLEVTSAVGEGPLLLLAAEAAAAPAATDVVLVPAEYCSDRSGGGLVARLKTMSHRVVVYGWTPALADMIEACDIDGFIEGPSWGKGISPQVFSQKLLQMQEARLRAAQSQAAQGGMVRSFSNMNLNAAANPLYSNSGAAAAQPAATAAATAANAAAPRSPLGRHSPVHAIARSLSKGKDNSRQSPIAPGGVTMEFPTSRGNSHGGAGSNMITSYTPVESPNVGRVSGGIPSFGSQGNLQNLTAGGAMSFGNVTNNMQGVSQGGGKPLRPSGTAGDAAAAAAGGVRATPALSEYDLLQQLMGEISRLKKELNE